MTKRPTYIEGQQEEKFLGLNLRVEDWQKKRP